MDFKLTKTQMLQQELFRKFAETEIKPIAKDMDEAEDYDRELLQKLQKIGAFGIPYSREYGGQGADVLTYTLCMEEMSKVDASTGITLSVHTSLCCPCINEFGTEEQKQKYLRPLVDGSKIGCFGLTEPGAGTDAAGVKTTAFGVLSVDCPPGFVLYSNHLDSAVIAGQAGHLHGAALRRLSDDPDGDLLVPAFICRFDERLILVRKNRF